MHPTSARLRGAAGLLRGRQGIGPVVGHYSVLGIPNNVVGRRLRQLDVGLAFEPLTIVTTAEVCVAALGSASPSNRCPPPPPASVAEVLTAVGKPPSANRQPAVG